MGSRRVGSTVGVGTVTRAGARARACSRYRQAALEARTMLDGCCAGRGRSHFLALTAPVPILSIELELSPSAEF
jgi:hypothetical protein